MKGGEPEVAEYPKRQRTLNIGAMHRIFRLIGCSAVLGSPKFRVLCRSHKS